MPHVVDVKRQDITFLNTLITLSPQTNRYKNEMKQVVELFKERRIPTVATAKKIIDLLGSTNKKANIKGLERFEEYKIAETPTGRLTRNKKPTKYSVKGTIKTTDKDVQVRRGQTTDYGQTMAEDTIEQRHARMRSKQKQKQKLRNK